MDDHPGDAPSLAGGDRPDADDVVFKALADPTRRLLLDRLRSRDGQKQTELEHGLPMTRFGVAKHLRVLEDAGLVVARRAGRDKLHFLNPAPIQRAYDRWVSAYARPWVGLLTDLARSLEDPSVTATATTTTGAAPAPAPAVPAHVYQVFIRTTPDKLWQALTDPALTALYYFGSPAEGDWRVGGAYRFPDPAGGVFVDGEVLEADPPRRLSLTMRQHWMGPENAANVSRVTWEIEPEGDVCKLTLVHEGMTPAEAEATRGGWARIVSGLKTLLETGQPMRTGA
jgi:uncharacterized protein YndB with AHSA1/START domain/DNA-binding transcriptional ArsR family regulator